MSETLSWINLETLGVVLALAFLLLATAENSACWPVAVVSSVVYMVVFWRAQLPLQAALNGFYLVTALYGWWAWRHAGEQSDERGELAIQRWPALRHALLLTAIAVLTLLSAYALRSGGDPLSWLLLDGFITWGAVAATVMATRKVLENWLYWIVLDAAAIYLYLERELNQTAFLFVIYTAMACYGYWRWRRHYLQLQTVAEG